MRASNNMVNVLMLRIKAGTTVCVCLALSDDRPIEQMYVGCRYVCVCDTFFAYYVNAIQI